jgi:hypothetical protein
VIDEVLQVVAPRGDLAELPECSIRAQCRWFAQSGAAACAACPEVVTDARMTEE